MEVNLFAAPKPAGRRARKPGVDRKPRQAYSAKQLEQLESEFKASEKTWASPIEILQHKFCAMPPGWWSRGQPDYLLL